VSIEIKEEKLGNLGRYYRPEENGLRWPWVFVLPGWLEAWWQSFGAGFRPLVLVAFENGKPVGIMPLKVQDGTASLIGDNSVCDYLDMITTEGKEGTVAAGLVDYLVRKDIKKLVLETLRPDSIAGHFIADIARARKFSVNFEDIDVSYEMRLPVSWDAYLEGLESKQRRDINRKIRQLENVSAARLTVLKDVQVGEAELSLFFDMMAGSRRDKQQFLTPTMQGFFRRVIQAMSGYGMLRLAFLDVGEARTAGILYFENDDTIYLYNSGYDVKYAGMDVGLISKLYCIRQAIEDGKKKFDFLKGPEPYKSQLGGNEIKLSRCVIDLE
jgi:CelD/BcsL family acetyltransferase involved in cellulose biosynthesis